MKNKICVLYGGASAERDVSLATAENILKNLDPEKYDVSKLEITADLNPDWINKLISLSPDLVLSTLHGGIGENGAVQGLLQCLSVPFTGSGILGSTLSLNKHFSKTLLRSAHVPTPESILVKSPISSAELEEALSKLGLPVIVKPNCGGSSIGVKKCETKEKVSGHINYLLEKGENCLVEQYIDGKEVSCIMLETPEGLKLLSLMDVNPKGEIYDYSEKYISPTPFVNKSELPKFMWSMIEEIGKKAFNALHLKGYCAADFILREEQVFLIEINSLPGFAPNSILTNTLKSLDIPLSDFLDYLIAFELNEKVSQLV